MTQGMCVDFCRDKGFFAAGVELCVQPHDCLLWLAALELTRGLFLLALDLSPFQRRRMVRSTPSPPQITTGR
jgi:hypothetical protein